MVDREEVMMGTTQYPLSNRPNSKIVQVNATHRRGGLLGLQALSSHDSDDRTELDPALLYNSVAAFLAVKQFNQRRGDILPHLPTLLGDCNFYVDYTVRDTQGSALEAARQLQLATAKARGNTEIHVVKQNADDNDGLHEETQLPQQDSSTTDIILTETQAPTAQVARTAPPRTIPPQRTLAPRNASSTTLLEAEYQVQHPSQQQRSSSSSTSTSPPTTRQTSPNDQQKRTRRRQRWLQQEDPTRTTNQQVLLLEPFAILGVSWSRVSQPLSYLTAALDVPLVSGTSTGAALSLSSLPYFARTVETNQGDALAAISYYHAMGVTHVAVLYVNDLWGVDYQVSLRRYGQELGVETTSFSYGMSSRTSLQQALQSLQTSQFRHVFAILHNYSAVLSMALDVGVIGRPDYSWIVADQVQWTGSAFALSKNHTAQADDLAHALHGIGILHRYYEPQPSLEQALEEFATNRTLQEEYIATLAEPNNLLLLQEGESDFSPYVPTAFTYTIFDAVLAMGLTACNVSNNNDNQSINSGLLPPLFTGPEFYKAMVETTSFEGVSGHVTFDPNTGTRLTTTEMRYAIHNIVLSENRSTRDAHRFESTLTTIVYGKVENHHQKHLWMLDHRAPFLYFDNTTNIPPSLPPLQNIQLNLVSKQAQAAGYAMASIVLLASLFFLAWTIRNRELFVVRASQPIFLGKLCVGTIVMALTVFPASLPGASTSMGPNPAMDKACMAQLWLAFLGYVTTFSALFSKTYRLNSLTNSGLSMRRMRVDAKDVMWNFVILMIINIAMLLCITYVAPYQYERIEMGNYDQFGRSTESYGSCRPQRPLFWFFVVIMFTANSLCFLMALFQSWKARGLPSEFSESYYLALALASFMETLCLGGPVLLVVYDDPTAWYLVSSAILCVGCMTILLPLMLPKYFLRKENGRQFLLTHSKMRSQRSFISGLEISGPDSIEPGNTDEAEGPPSLKRGFMIIHRNDSTQSYTSRTPTTSTGRRMSNLSKPGSSGRVSFRLGNIDNGPGSSGLFTAGGESDRPLFDTNNVRDNGFRRGSRLMTIQQSIHTIRDIELSGFDMSDSEGPESVEEDNKSAKSFANSSDSPFD